MPKKEVWVILIILLIVIVPITSAFSFSGFFKGFFSFITGHAGSIDSSPIQNDDSGSASPFEEYDSGDDAEEDDSSDDIIDDDGRTEIGDDTSSDSPDASSIEGGSSASGCYGDEDCGYQEYCDDGECVFDCSQISEAGCIAGEQTNCEDKTLYSCEFHDICGHTYWVEDWGVDCCNDRDCYGDDVCSGESGVVDIYNDLDVNPYTCYDPGSGGENLCFSSALNRDCYNDPCATYKDCKTEHVTTTDITRGTYWKDCGDNEYCCVGSCTAYDPNEPIDDNNYHNLDIVSSNDTNQTMYSPAQADLSMQEGLIVLQENVISKIKVNENYYEIQGEIIENEGRSLIRIYNQNGNWVATVAAGVYNPITNVNNEQNPFGKLGLLFGNDIVTLNWISIDKISLLKTLDKPVSGEDDFIILLPR